MPTFERLLNPRAIAVVGASPEPSRPGAQAVNALRDHGYQGRVYPVNPKYAEIAGYRCYAALSDIDDACDLAVIALPAQHVPAVVSQCGARGIPYAVVQGGGFREAGEAGARLEAEMLSVARAGGVRLIGPNCLGLVNVHARAYAAFGSLTRPPRLRPGPVSAVAQSASFGTCLVAQCDAIGVGFRYVVTSGNEADITAPELIGAYVDDPETRVILAYLEGVGDGRGFMAEARRAQEAGKPFVVIKAGNTAQGKRAAASHTANLTGNYDVYRAAFRQCGVVEVDDVQEAADAVACFAAGRIPKGRGVAVMGGSGGAAAMFADRADQVGLEMPPLAPHTLARLQASLPPLASLANPVDYTAGYPRQGPGLDFRAAFQAAIEDPNVHQLAVMFAAAGRKQLEYGAQVLAQVAAASDKPIVVYSGMTPEIAPEGHRTLREAAIPVLSSAKRAASALAALVRFREARERRGAAAQAARFDLPELPAGPATLNEREAKRLVAAAGVPVVEDVVLPLQPDAAACAALPYPLALKILSPDILHKSDVGGVRLDIRDADELVAAAAHLVADVRRGAPQARLEGLLASPMVSGGSEAIVGVVNDEAFGPVVAVGLGGLFTELMRDVAYRVAPFGTEEALAMIGELRGRALFEGVRGRPTLDVDALARALGQVSQLAWQLRDRLAEMDLNPLMVRAQGHGVVAVDALVVLR